MCGICGFIREKIETLDADPIIRRMAQKLIHRGPDDGAVLLRDNMAFGFRRLGLIDLVGGMQPIYNEDASIVLICNGEIFNHDELRKELISKDHKFRTMSDVEVILHLYEEYDKAFMNALNGQFSFALYDFNKSELFCARDQAGIAPFYYTVVEEMFIFASEIKAILEYPGIERKVDLVALDQILTFPSVIAPRTMFEGIHSLENGNYLTFSVEKGLSEVEYWDMNYVKADEKKATMSEKEYIEELDRLLRSSISYRLKADVPVGVYLSGGLDSSVILGMIHDINKEKSIKSFSIDFEDRDISEKKYQELMVKHTGSDHNETLFSFQREINNLKKVVYHCEYPLKETYNLASIRLSEMVNRNGMKAVLSGEGSDELFGGYIGYKFDKIRSQGNTYTEKEKKLNNKIFMEETFVYEKRLLENREVKKSLYSQCVRDKFEEIECLKHKVVDTEKLKDRELYDVRSYVDIKLRLVENLLADHGDRMGFANSVEVRYPFLDKRIMEFAAQIPSDLKVKGFDGKYVLKQVAQAYISQNIIKRPKTPFVAPGSTALLKLHDPYIEHLLSYETISKQRYFDADKIEELKAQYQSEGFKLESPYEDDLLFIVITFGIFLDLYDMPPVI